MKILSVKYLLFILIVSSIFVACEEDEENQIETTNFCNTPVNAQDSLIIGSYHLFFNTIIRSDSTRIGLIELVDLNNNRIDTLSNLNIHQIKVKGSGNCFETTNFTPLTVNNGIALQYSNVPAWAPNPLNQAIIEIDINGIHYYLEDSSVNN